jgi:hypothetical protein
VLQIAPHVPTQLDCAQVVWQLLVEIRPPTVLVVVFRRQKPYSMDNAFH